MWHGGRILRKVKGTGNVLVKKSPSNSVIWPRTANGTQRPGSLLFGPSVSYLLSHAEPNFFELTFFSDGICSLFGFVLQVTHHMVYLGLMPQEERTDDALIEQFSPVGGARGHAPQQEAALHRKRASTVTGGRWTSRQHTPPTATRDGTASAIVSNSISSVFCELQVGFS